MQVVLRHHEVILIISFAVVVTMHIRVVLKRISTAM